MIETKVEKVLPEEEEHKIEHMSRFGWTLKSTQEVNNSESHLENRHGDVYSVTTRENYVRLVFERDREMPNREELVRLEKEFDAILSQRPIFSAPLLICGLVLGFIVAAYLRYVLPSIPILVFAIPLLLPDVIYIVSFTRKVIKYSEYFVETQNRIYEEADGLLCKVAD